MEDDIWWTWTKECREVMMKKRVLPVAAAVLAASCNTPHTAWLEVGVGAGYAADIFEMEWPAGSGDHVVVNQSLTDSAGLAGIKVEVRLPGAPSRTLTAIDFLGRLNNTVDGIEVPKEGTASIFVKLYQHGELVTEGHTSWSLDSGVRSWNLLVARVPVAFGVAIHEEDPIPRCHFPWCHRIERIEIDENARNHPHEALWLVLDRHSISGWEGIIEP